VVSEDGLGICVLNGSPGAQGENGVLGSFYPRVVPDKIQEGHKMVVCACMRGFNGVFFEYVHTSHRLTNFYYLYIP